MQRLFSNTWYTSTQRLLPETGSFFLSFEISNTQLPRLTLDSLCSPGRLPTWYLPVSVSELLGFGNCIINPGLTSYRTQTTQFYTGDSLVSQGKQASPNMLFSVDYILIPRYQQNCSSQNLPLVIFWVCLCRGQRLVEPKLNIRYIQTIWTTLHKYCYVLSLDISFCSSHCFLQRETCMAMSTQVKGSVSIFCF